MNDASNGYERVAAEFIAGRGSRPGVGIGARTVREWVTTIRPGGAALDLGCGPGYPMTHILVESGLDVYAVDASPSMVARFQARFPGIPIECNSVERSTFFGRKFDAVLAWGLLFLLTPAAQVEVIGKVAGALERGGKFLFTAPPYPGEWLDAMTGVSSESLGATAYRQLLEIAGLRLGGETEDEGGNHYYLAFKAER